MGPAQPRLSALPPGRLVWAGSLVLLAAYAALWVLVPWDAGLLQQLWFLPGVGVVGAIIANTSGTGGGVVFVPAFNALREHGVMALDPLQIVAVSMGIQAFGMTMGSLRWVDRLFHQPVAQLGSLDAPVRPRDFLVVSVGVLLLSLPAMLVTQRLAVLDPQDLLLGYKTFSILLGLALIITTWTVNRTRPELDRLHRVDLLVLLLLAIPGGYITALFSVGIGELVALYLFIRHYPILLCTGTACVISAASMILGSIWHVDAGTIQWEVVLLAAPAAVLGGFLARPIAIGLGARRLKTLVGGWIVLSAFYLVWLNAS
ncbi:MAG: sulfite exporter TauE/SafE family protein [Sphingomonadaceae bacterium]|nr:sulfite exporter TauE/SafE family protein [Sphingomonadaceae bacterium]